MKLNSSRNYAIISLLSLFLPYLSHGFVDHLKLVELNGKKILLVGDRHIVVDDAPQSLISKELHDINVFNSFISKLADSGTKHDWVVESSKLTLKLMTGVEKSELLYAIPAKALSESTRNSNRNIGCKLSDFRRERIKDPFIDGSTICSMLIQQGVPLLTKLEAWSEQDLLWLDQNGDQPLHPNDLIPKIDGYLRSNPTFHAKMNAAANNLARQIDQIRRTKFGQVITFGDIKKKFDIVLSDILAAQSASKNKIQSILLKDVEHGLKKCESERTAFMLNYQAKENLGLDQFMFSVVKKDNSLQFLNKFAESNLGKCVLTTLPEAGFLLDVLKSQKEVSKTVVFLGGLHIARLADQLSALGYKTVFEEGRSDYSDSLVRNMNAWDKNDTPIDNQVLSSRLSEVLEQFPKHESSLRDEL